MKIYRDARYGCDLDGNRGWDVVEYELEGTDAEKTEIADALFADGVASDETGEREVEYDGVTISVEVSIYKDELKHLEEMDDVVRR